MTADQVKTLFRQRGITFTQWAEENGYSRYEVYRVLNGQTKARYGKSHGRPSKSQAVIGILLIRLF